MKYRAMIFDLDGTVMPSFIESTPSDEVVKAVRSLRGNMKLSSASGRAVIACRTVWKALSLTDPCIVNGGSQIVSPTTEEILWEQKLPPAAVEKIVAISMGYTDTFLINGEKFERRKDQGMFPTSANIVVAYGVQKEKGDAIVRALSMIPDVTVLILHSWVEGEYWDIHVTHRLATKKHAIEILMDILQVKKEEVIGIGDGNNDMPLFASVGYKVAMGNAVEVLKKEADCITDTLDNNGVATFINEKLPLINT